FPSRRLYRDRFGSCRLGELERQVLGLERHEDVPSFEIPSLYFRYVRQRRFRALLPIFQHNALDVLSMVTLTAHLGDLYRGRARMAGEDSLALGHVCEGDGYQEEAIDHYRSALGANLPPVPRDDAERALSLLYKRLGRWDEAVALWHQAAGRAENRSLYPLIELARFYEREARDLEAAIQHGERALALLRRHHLRLGASGAQAEEQRIERRLARVRVRLGRANLTPRPPALRGKGERTNL
ncbi:MAG TPA: ribonuclease H-like domain-containing protein, partial [Steroidobacteraceae bacterium]|nr:ribonuclease H-like domain-containing protein [Steroidobacteraceae bacterium]